MKKWSTFRLLLFLVVAISGPLFFLKFKTAPTMGYVAFWIETPPYSTDPLDFDAFAHHETFRSVLAGLVSQYKVGTYVGILADRWQVNNDKTQWRFHIRSNLVFANNDPITPNIIVKSFTRIAFLLKKNNSPSEVFDHTIGHEAINSPETKFKGLYAEGDEVVFNFIKPEPMLLEKISFGLYSIAHPADYDSTTGDWRNKRSVISSYAYQIKSWTETKFVLSRRPDFLPEIFHPHPIEEIHYIWDPIKINQADLISLDSTLTSLGSDYRFYGKTPSGISYVHCLSWKDPDSPCHSKNFRIQFREKLYQAMEEHGSKIIRSFFPLAMKGIHEFPAPSVDPKPLLPLEIANIHFRISKSLTKYFSDFVQVMPAVTKEFNMQAKGVEIPFVDFLQEVDPDKQNHKIDIAVRGTGILIENPLEDIVFMIKSKAGIRLPDEDGSIHAEIANNNFSVQKVNELLWDQAIIWPLGHYATGLWARNNLDLRQLNHVLPPVELPWIGWR